MYRQPRSVGLAVVGKPCYHVRRVLEKHNIRIPSQGSPARPIRYVFSLLNIYMYSPDKKAGAVSAKCFLAKKGTDGSSVGRGC
jgi:hypothetical protein